MINRIGYALFNRQSFWREFLAHSVLNKSSNPGDWLSFRQEVTKLCAVRRKGSARIRKCGLAELFPGISSTASRVQNIPTNPYNVTWNELVALSVITAHKLPQAAFEFGTFDGRTTLHLALNSEKVKVHTIDIISGDFDFGINTPYFRKVRVGEHFIGQKCSARIEQITGDSKTYDFSRFKKCIDLIFIDAEHSYDGVMNDTRVAFEMIRPGGVILWHDYLLLEGVTKALDEISARQTIFNLEGTTLAVCTSC